MGKMVDFNAPREYDGSLQRGYQRNRTNEGCSLEGQSPGESGSPVDMGNVGLNFLTGSSSTSAKVGDRLGES